MLQWVKALVDERLKDCLAVVLPNGAVLAAVNLAQLNAAVTILAGLVTIGYAVWRWRRDSYVACKACIEGRRDQKTCPYPPGKRPAWCPLSLQ